VRSLLGRASLCVMAGSWPWDRLPVHAALIDRLREVVEAEAAWRWLEVCCSLAVGRGDELSDVDAAIGYDDGRSLGELDDAALAVVRRCGEVVDALVHVLPGWPPETRRVAAELDSGVQLDLVLMPATRRVGLPTGAVAVVDKDGRLASPWRPPAEEPPSPVAAREWLLLGWWALGDVAKHVRRGSLYEAVERLTEARQHALRLHAVAERTPFPSFGLVSLLDSAPFRVPGGLGSTYALPEPSSVLAAATVVAELLEASADRAGAELGVALETAWTGAVRARLDAAASPE